MIKETEPIIKLKNLSCKYNGKQALKNITMDIPRNYITAFIGPSGCGKSTLLRCLNRLNDLIDYAIIDGIVELNSKNIYDHTYDVIALRKQVGMVFQKSNPFSGSIYDNVAYGPRIAGIKEISVLDEVVERSLKAAALWDEVKDSLGDNALSLSGGQQQRLCIARAVAVEPEILLLDEPCSALDPIATGRIEDLMKKLKSDYTIIVITHNMQQAARVSDFTAFMYMGRLIEYNETEKIFVNPDNKLTLNYVAGGVG